MICAIVTADKNWAIGKNGKQLTTIPDEVRYIRSTTTGNTVIMGRKTFESYPHGQIPVNRNNIVLSRNKLYKPDEAVVCASVEEALKEAKKYGGDIYVLGGGKVFEAMLDFVDEVQVTEVDYSYDADTYFPNLDKMPEWVMVEKSDEMTHFDTVYHIEKYLKRKDYQA